MSDFGVRLHAATQILATGEGDVKNRLGLSAINECLFANFPDDPKIPKYFREKQARILKELSARTWGHGLKGDRVRATIRHMRFKTAASYTSRILQLYNEFQEDERSGFVPEGD